MDGEFALEILTKFTRLNLQTFGAWPAQKNEKLCRGLFIICFSCLIFGVFLPQTLKMVQVGNNFDLLSHILCTAELSVLIALAKMIVFFANKNKITIIYNNMIEHWNKKKSKAELNIMMENGRSGRKFALTCIILSYSTVHGRLFQWIIENLNNWENPKYYKNYTLYVEAYFPYQWNYTPVFELTSFLEYLGIMCAAFSNSGTDSFFNHVTFHFIGQYQILRSKLTNLIKNIENMSESAFNEEFKLILYVHYHINSCIQVLESCFNVMFLIQLLCCSVQFCLQAYFFILFVTDDNPISLLPAILFILIFFMFQAGSFYIYCYCAEMLQIESYAFADTAYETEWFHLPSQKAKCLLLLMLRGNKPVSITAGKFCVLNFMMFGNIIKTSMGYLSFLITMKK